MTKKFVCVQGSPEVPKGTEVLFNSGFNTTWCAPNNVAWTRCPLELWQVEGNECWEEVKEETISHTPAKRWKPKVGQPFYCLDESGFVGENEWDGTLGDERMWEIGNCFQTEQDARDEVKRRESIANAWRPKDKEEWWAWDYSMQRPSTVTFTNIYDSLVYIGAVHPTEEACQKWGKTYAKYCLPKTE